MGERDTQHYMPGLDGVRALAVGAVLAFHAGFGWASGGFLGVSVFFTLSGYLIIGLLLAEHERSGRIALGAFYGRRARRLLPASLICLALVVACSPLWSAGQLERLPGDVLAALANVANWRFATSTIGYRALFEQAPSPVAHFWSLAIEEQCYLVLPLVAAVALRRGARVLGGVLAALTAMSIGAMLLTSDFDLAYNGTHTRAAELLIGALAAVMLRSRPSVGARRGVQGLGAVALAVLVFAVGTVHLDDAWLLRGGFSAVALLSVAVVVSSTAGPMARVLGIGPLAAIGRRSYGLYLFHWPVFLLLDANRTGLSGIALIALRLAVAWIVTVASYRFIERPVRERRVLVRPRVALATMGAGFVAVAALAIVVVPEPARSSTDELLESVRNDEVVTFGGTGGGAGAGAGAGAASAGAPGIDASTISAAPPLRVLVIGSRPIDLSELTPDRFDVASHTSTCPVTAAAEVDVDGTRVDTSKCDVALFGWDGLVSVMRPDVIVLSLGPIDGGTVRMSDAIGFPTDIADAGQRIAEMGRRMAQTQEYLRITVGALAAKTGRVLIAADGVPPWFDMMVSEQSLNAANVTVLPTDRIAITLRWIDSGRRAGGGVPVAAPIDTSPRRVLVLGDSTSVLVAKALGDGSDGRLSIRWAGKEGCPIVVVEATRAATQQPWTPSTCVPVTTTLPALLSDERPDAMLIVAGGMEMLEQRYAGDPNGYVAGTEGFQRAHDAVMDDIVALVRPYAIPIVIADAPQLGYSSFSSGEMATPERAAAWNAQIQRWADAHPEVEILPYAGPLQAYEAEYGGIRPDGSHPEIGPLTDIARASLVEPLLELIRTPRA
ncbi:MAG: acyltransferase family protein [Ilumatobacteraceae bacterium]